MGGAAASGVGPGRVGFFDGVALLRGVARGVGRPVSSAGVVFRGARFRAGGPAGAEMSVAVGVPVSAEVPAPVRVSGSAKVSASDRVSVSLRALAGPAGLAGRSGGSWPSVGEVLPAATPAARLRVVRRAAGVPGVASRAGGPSVPASADAAGGSSFALVDPPAGGLSSAAPRGRMAGTGGGTGDSAAGGWNSTGGAALPGRAGFGRAGASASEGCCCRGGAGGGVKVASGERRRAGTLVGRRGGSLGGCSCMWKERSRERDLAHAGIRRTVRWDGCPRPAPTSVLSPVGIVALPRVGADLYPRPRWSAGSPRRLRLVWSMAPHC